MKTIINATAITAGISGGLFVNRMYSAPLAGKLLDKTVGLANIPKWGQTLLGDLLLAGHVVAGIAAGSALGSGINSLVNKTKKSI